jgi:hypothetical protein
MLRILLGTTTSLILKSVKVFHFSIHTTFKKDFSRDAQNMNRASGGRRPADALR